MQKWEYQTIIAYTNGLFTVGYYVRRINDEDVPGDRYALNPYLRQVGQEGWEVASTLPVYSGAIMIIFKRQIG